MSKLSTRLRQMRADMEGSAGITDLLLAVPPDEPRTDYSLFWNLLDAHGPLTPMNSGNGWVIRCVCERWETPACESLELAGRAFDAHIGGRAS